MTNGEMVQNPRSIDSVDNPNYLSSENISSYAFVDYSEKATVHLKQIYPFPLTINSISLDVTLADTNA